MYFSEAGIFASFFYAGICGFDNLIASIFGLSPYQADIYFLDLAVFCGNFFYFETVNQTNECLKKSARHLF